MRVTKTGWKRLDRTARCPRATVRTASQVTGSAMPSYEADIKPLFRESDRNAMMFAFDLWSYEDVKENASDILARIEDGSMPCDEPWDEQRIEKLKAWIAAGCPP